MMRNEHRELIIINKSTASIILFCTFLVGCSSKSALDTSKQETKAVNRPSLLCSTKGVPDGSIIIDGDVFEVKVSPEWVDKIDKKRKILRSKTEAIGKIAGRGLASGDFVYADQLSLPTKPKRGEQWLFTYPNSVLEKYVGKKITLKGELFPGVDRSFRILSYDSTGRVIVLGKIPKELASMRSCCNRRVATGTTGEKCSIPSLWI